MSQKPIILKLGHVEYAQEAWNKLGKIATVIEVDSLDREAFIKDLQSKYKGAVAIARTFASFKQTGRFDEELIKHFPPNLKAVAHNGAGYDQIDAKVLGDAGIQVSNVPDLANEATADTHMFLMLATMRNFQSGHDRLIKGEWFGQKAAGAAPGRDLKGKTLGIIGMGGIGRDVRDRAAAFGFKEILYNNRRKLSDELAGIAKYTSFDELLEKSDVISVNVPLSQGTRHLINKAAIDKMKKSAVIINTSRGPVIDEEYLIEALHRGDISGAGLDVYEREPQVPQQLSNNERVVTLPHMGTHTLETMLAMEEAVVVNVTNYLKTGTVKTIVPEQKETKFNVKPIVS